MRSSSLMVLALSLGSLAGCGEEAEPVVAPAPSARKKVEAAAPISASSQVDYVYSPINKRDPFRPLILEGGPKGPTEGTDVQSCTEPLCLVDIDDLNVVAVVSGDANPLAMVEDRAGVGHVVRRNTRVGKQGGKVTQILRDCIVVTSFISGGADGKPQANKQNMCVKTDSRSVEPLDLLKGKEFTQ
ncbi:MAG: pilus assembly protein PilP [Archangium sp.]|nr:pilus assembly protein PilP [Archangium sp.]MDP3571517.1 pilus assembly protein PilP [Archangium sp.]